MRISSNVYNQQQPTSTSFKSSFVRSRDLKATFNYFNKNQDLQTARQYANAVEGLLKDGKNDKLSFVKNSGYVKFAVNGKEYSRFETKKESIYEKMIHSIIDFAEKERGIKKVQGTDYLTPQEIEATKTQIIDFDKNGKPKYLDLQERFQKLIGKKDGIEQDKLKKDVLTALFNGTQDRLTNLGIEISKPAKCQEKLSYEEILNKVLN